MNRAAFMASLLFALASGIYWFFIGQLLPIVVPMMLNDYPAFYRVAIETLVALAIYIAGAMVFFRWLLSRPRS